MEALARPFADHPRRVLLIVALVLLPLLSYFFLYPFEIESDVRRGFAQSGGRSNTEFKKFADFYNITYEGLEIWVVLVTAKRTSERQDLEITGELLDEIARLDDYVQNFSLVFNGETVHFKDLQTSELNYLFHYYKKAFVAQDFFGTSAVNLSFPVAEAFGHRLFLGSHFFGVNQHRPTERGPLERAQYVGLWYMSEAPTHDDKKKLQAIQMALFSESQRDDFSSIMSFWMYGDQVANAEMLRGTKATVQLFLVGVVLMVVFMLFMFNYLTLKSQILVTTAALLAPVLAFTSCFAILGWLGIPFNAIMSITPFLVMGIGVDDAFLLVHCWRRRANEASKRRRFAAVIHEIGPSMLITSATNAMAFGIGITSPTPQMAGFCLCTSIAVLLDFVFEFLVFVPMMILHYEEKNDLKSKLKSARCVEWSWLRYTRTLLSPLGRVTVLVFTILLFVSATVGVRKLVPSFDPSKTFPYDSDLMIALRRFEQIQSEYAPANFITSTVPQANDTKGMNELLALVSKLENQPHCYGRERSQFIFRDYLEKQESNNVTLSYEGLPDYLTERMVAKNTILKLSNDSGHISVDGTNFMVVCKGSVDWNVRAERIDMARAIIDEYPELGVTLFDYEATIYDLIITVKKELIKAVLLTFLSMVVACALFIPSVIGTTLATLSMLSISYSLLGWLSIWGQDLDPVTMINVLMAIGFSVDFSAHVCYHFHLERNDQMPVEQRITRILASVGRPMVEASLSTLLCMIPLFFVPVYIIVAFAKTVCLVATLGLAHGIAIIPVILSFIAKDPPPMPERENMLK